MTAFLSGIRSGAAQHTHFRWTRESAERTLALCDRTELLGVPAAYLVVELCCAGRRPLRFEDALATVEAVLRRADGMTPAASSDAALFFDRSGEPTDLARYAELHADIGYRILARDSVGESQPLEVVTAWLGMDQAFGDDPAPLIFGTVALDQEGQLWQGQERVAATETQALLNHHALVAELS